MKNSLTFITDSHSVSAALLNQLETALTTAVTDTNYYQFVLTAIAKKHFNPAIQAEAARFASKQTRMQDDLDYLNSCISFLRLQMDKAPNFSTLSETEILERAKALKNDVWAFIEIQENIQRACFRFTNQYFHGGFGQSVMAA